MAEDPRIGTQIAGYRFERMIGRGGMGLVYLAEHLHLQRMVALKLLAPEVAAGEGFRERFMRESRTAASIQHPNIVTVYDAGEAGDMLYIAMQFVDGTDLATVLQREGPLAPERALTILGEVGSALDAAHARGLVHRDVKPGNILLDSDRAYLTDFGLTRRTDSKSGFTKTGQFLGTIDYVSPEQIEGRDVDGRTDVYALGCVLYECLTAEKPYARDSDLAVIYAHIQSEPPRVCERRGDLPPGFDEVIWRALAKGKDDRWQSCTAMVAAARTSLADGGAAGPAAVPGPPPTAAEPGPPVITHAATPEQTRAREPEPAGVETPAPRTRQAWEPESGAATVKRPGEPAAPEEVRPTGPTARLHGQTGDPTAPLPGGPTAPLPAGTKRTRRLPLVPLGIGAGLIAVAALALVLTSGGGDEGGGGGGGDGGSNAAGRVSATFPVETRPFGVAIDGENVYVVNQDSESVTRVRTDGSGRTAFSAGAGPFWATIGGNGAIWVTNRDDDSVTRIAPDTPEDAESFPVGDAPYWVVERRGTVWVVNGDDETVTRLNEASGEPLGPPIPVGAAPRAIAIANGSAWVTNGEDNTVTRLDEETGEVIGRPTPVGAHPIGISAEGGFLWVANEQDNSVTRIHADTAEPVGDPIPVGKEPFDIASGEGSVWVSNAADDTVTRIDAETGRVVGEPIPVGDQPTGITEDGGLVWVALNDANAVQRIEPRGR